MEEKKIDGILYIKIRLCILLNLNEEVEDFMMIKAQSKGYGRIYHYIFLSI